MAANVFGDAPIYQQLCLDMGMVPDLPPVDLTLPWDDQELAELFQTIAVSAHMLDVADSAVQSDLMLRLQQSTSKERNMENPADRLDEEYLAQLEYEQNEQAIDAIPGMREAIDRTHDAPRDFVMPRLGPDPGESVLACPARKCKLANGHDSGVHGRQQPRTTMLGRPIPNRATRRAKRT